MEDLENFVMEMNEDDMFISEASNGYNLSCEQRHIAKHEDLEAIEQIAKNWMSKNGFYPNVWYINDRGNTHLHNF